MIVTVTCIECVKQYSTDIPKQAMDQYHDGIPPELAFSLVSTNARNLVVDKMCPTCWAQVMSETTE